MEIICELENMSAIGFTGSLHKLKLALEVADAYARNLQNGMDLSDEFTYVGNASFSVMANTLRGLYGTDVLVAPASSFTGSVLQADYTQTTARAMIMPNGLMSYRRTMTGAELKDTVRAFVEGCEGGFTPFNRGSLPVVSGIAVQVQENDGSYTLTGITRGGQPLQDDDTVTVTCLATEKQMAPLLQDESRAFERGEATVKDAWSEALSGGSVTLAAPESYITFGGG